MSIWVTSTEDVEVRLEQWKSTNLDLKEVIGRDQSGIWWNDKANSTHLLKWDELMQVQVEGSIAKVAGTPPWVKDKEEAPGKQEQLEMGKKVEMEHADTIKWLVKKLGPGPGYADKVTDKLIQEVAAKIASDHLKEMPDYYTRLAKMEGAHGSNK